MKRLLMGLAACTLIMTSCNKQEVVENVDDGQGLLSFTPGLGKATRASEWTNTSLQGAAKTDTPIKMYAYQETTTLGTFEDWFNDGLYYDGAAKVWKITSARFRNTVETKFITYFPQTGKLVEVDNGGKNSFKTADFVTGGTFPAFTYTVAKTSDLQEDMIVGVTVVAANTSNITVAMRHILSQVNFGVVGYTGAKIAIRNIQIKDLKSSAVYTYGADNTAPVGKWDNYKGTQDYNYFNYTNQEDAITFNVQPTTPADATTGDRYIFGDGGKWGPGKGIDTFYPIGVDNAWATHTATATPLANSLMLMPQELISNDTKVTFEYKIQDVDDAFVAGGPTDAGWAEGEFKLNFKTGITDKDYKAEWEQNMRYVYMIDFTKFLDGLALTFTVDVDMQPWENHDGEDGVIDIVVAGQPTAANINTVRGGGTFYIANQTITAPTAKEWAQVIRDEEWNMSGCDFRLIEKDGTIKLNFQNVIFNTKDAAKDPTAIKLTLPKGYNATKTVAGDPILVTLVSGTTYTISEGDRSANAVVTITNTNAEYSTNASLGTAITAVNTDRTALIYKGVDEVDLTTMEPALTITNEIMTVEFKVTVPTVGAAINGTWIYDSAKKTATYTRR